MKSGASDPFSDDEGTDETPDGTEATTPTDASETAAGSSAARNGPDQSDGDDSDARQLSREQLPLVLRRDRVKDERPEVHQLFVQAETHERAIDAERELEARLDADLARTDAREAIYLAGMAHLDDAEQVLREWGYDL